MKKQLFGPVTKIDSVQRLVYGYLAEERKDKDGEKFDYAGSKPYFQAWNSSFAEKTIAAGQEASVGNLRAMHKAVSAGAFREMEYDDASRKIAVCAHVVDDQEWAKVESGVYTGFSIGARVVGKKRKDDSDGSILYVADPYEGSLVDNPCMYGATFTEIKADGAVTKNFAGKNSGAISKGLYTVQYFAQLVDMCDSLAESLQYETDYEGDDSPIAAQVRDACKSLSNLLVDYVREEVDELNGDKEAAQMKNTGRMEAGIRPEAGAETVQKDAAASAAAAAARNDSNEVNDLKKSVATLTETVEKLAKAVAAPAAAPAGAQVEKIEIAKADFERLQQSDRDLKALGEQVTKLAQSVEAIAKQVVPTPVKVNTSSVVVNKGEDVNETVDVTKMTQEQKMQLASKLIYSQPNSRVLPARQA